MCLPGDPPNCEGAWYGVRKMMEAYDAFLSAHGLTQLDVIRLLILITLFLLGAKLIVFVIGVFSQAEKPKCKQAPKPKYTIGERVYLLECWGTNYIPPLECENGYTVAVVIANRQDHHNQWWYDLHLESSTHYFDLDTSNQYKNAAEIRLEPYKKDP